MCFVDISIYRDYHPLCNILQDLDNTMNFNSPYFLKPVS